MSADWWLEDADGKQLAEYNLTYNLNRMLWEAGWRWGVGGPPKTSFPNPTVWPHELDGMKARDLGEKVARVVVNLANHPDEFRKFNPPNGWGDYEGCLSEMGRFLDDIVEYPDATVRCWV